MVPQRVSPPKYAVRSKRIAFICFSRSLGGLELTTLRLAEAMSRRGFQILLVVPPASPLEQRARESSVGVSVVKPRLKYGDFAAAIRLGVILRKQKIQTAILTQSKDIHLATLATLFSRTTALVFYQQMDSGYDKRDLLHTWMFSRLSRWVTLTERMRQNVVEHTRVPDGKIAVAPLGIDLVRFNPARVHKSDARAFFKLPKNAVVIGVLGRLDPQKGQEILVRAVPDVAKTIPNVHVVLAGDETAGEPGFKTHLEDVCRQLGILERVTMLPFTEDVPRLLASIDLFVLPSFSETYGLVVIEAMAMEKPILATRAGGVPEIIEDGKTGMFIEPRDVQSTSKAIVRVLTSRTLRTTLSRAARRAAIKRFNVDRCTDSLIDLVTSF